MNERSGDPLFSAQRWAQVRASLDELEAQPPDVRRARLQEIAGSDADLAAASALGVVFFKLRLTVLSLRKE